MPIKFESRRKKVQRFLSDDEGNLDNIWLSLVIAWIQGNIKQNNVVYLARDRTKWQSNNILTLIPIHYEGTLKYRVKVEEIEYGEQNSGTNPGNG